MAVKINEIVTTTSINTDDKVVVTQNGTETRRANAKDLVDKFTEGIKTNVSNLTKTVQDNKTEILSTIGDEEIGTVATSVKGAIKEIATQLNENSNEVSNIKTDYAKKLDVNTLATNKAEKIDLDNLQGQVTSLVLGASEDGNNAEVVQSRTSSSGSVFSTLKENLDSISNGSSINLSDISPIIKGYKSKVGTWELGAIGGDNGKDTNANGYIRTKGYYKFTNNLKVYKNNLGTLRIFVYDLIGAYQGNAKYDTTYLEFEFTTRTDRQYRFSYVEDSSTITSISRLVDKFTIVDMGNKIEFIKNIENNITSIENDIIKNNNKRKVILDTDFNSDVDDIIAIRCLSWGHRYNLIDLYGICLSTNAKQVAEGNTYYQASALDSLLKYDGVYNIDFGINNTYDTYTSNFYSSMCSFYHTVNNNNECLDSKTFYRKKLSEIPDGEKCDIVTIGYLVNISDLLNSVADSYSSLNGLELIKEKVNKIYVMGGNYPTSTAQETNFAGTNSARMISATSNVFANCPVPIVFNGVGWGISSGKILTNENMTYDIVYKALQEYWNNRGASDDKPGRWSWDPLTVLICCLGIEKTGFSLVRGTNTINIDTSSPEYGFNTFNVNLTGNHYYTNALYDNDFYVKLIDDIIVKKTWI